MAVRSLSIVDVDAPKTRKKVAAKKATPKKKVVVDETMLAEIAAVEKVGSAENTPVSVTVLPTVKKLPKKKVSKKTAAKKSSTKKSAKKVADNEHYGHEPLSHYPSNPKAKIKNSELRQIKRHPLGHLLLETKLRDAGFRGGISSDKKFLERYSTDESIFQVRPQVVLQPKSKHDIQIAVKLIAIETKRFTSLSLTPRAAGTGLSGGSLTDSISIDVVPHLHRIGEV